MEDKRAHVDMKNEKKCIEVYYNIIIIVLSCISPYLQPGNVRAIGIEDDFKRLIMSLQRSTEGLHEELTTSLHQRRCLLPRFRMQLVGILPRMP